MLAESGCFDCDTGGAGAGLVLADNLHVIPKRNKEVNHVGHAVK